MSSIEHQPVGYNKGPDIPRYWGEAVGPTTGQRYDWHSHENGQLIFTTLGSIYVGVSNRVLLLSPAMILWIPPNIDHWLRYGSNNQLHYVGVREDEAEKIGADYRIMRMTALLHALMSATLPDVRLGCTGAHNKAFFNLLRHELIEAPDIELSISMPRDERIRRFTEEALLNPGQIESIDTWLADCPASRKTIERLFTKETGMPPSQWLRQASVLHAVSKLSAGEKVSSVAHDLGYATSSAFSYMFRRTLGCSPNDFRTQGHQSRSRIS